MVSKVGVVTGTRADYGLLRPLLFRLRDNRSISLDLIVTGSHLSQKFGNTKSEIIEDGFSEFCSIQIPLDDDSKGGMAKSTGDAICRFAEYFETAGLNLLVVLGDRFEVLSAVVAARILGIPVAHISGGDVTEGAIDDSIRHSITKMSQIHFPGCEQSRLRIIQMGEQPDTVFNVGEPGVENAKKMNLLTRDELARSLRFYGVLSDYSLVTFHPVTVEDNTGAEQVIELIRAMDSIPDMYYIVTMANADAGGRTINDIWVEEGRKHPNWFVVNSLGVRRYLSAMKYAKSVIGNSSSGIVEAPSFGIPTVNIGDRQKGRMLSPSVICCEPSCKEIERTIREALSEKVQKEARSVVSPFGEGNTSELIEKHLVDYLNDKSRTQKKAFYDIEFSIGENR